MSKRFDSCSVRYIIARYDTVTNEQPRLLRCPANCKVGIDSSYLADKPRASPNIIMQLKALHALVLRECILCCLAL
jgi:hypothetical protein